MRLDINYSIEGKIFAVTFPLSCINRCLMFILPRSVSDSNITELRSINRCWRWYFHHKMCVFLSWTLLFLQWHLFPRIKQRMHRGDSQLSLVSLVLRNKIILYYQFSAVSLNITVGPMCQQGFGVRICLLTPPLYAVYNADMSEKKRSHSFCTLRLTPVYFIGTEPFFLLLYKKKGGFIRPLNFSLMLICVFGFKEQRKAF